MKTLLSTVAVATLLGAATAQSTSLPRGVTEVGTSPSPTGQIGWLWWKTASPSQKLPVTGPNSPATADLVYLTYSDTEATTRIPQLEFRRSEDGGLTWTTPIVLHKAGTTEKFGTDGAQLVCRDRSVFVFFRSNAQDPSKADGVSVHCYGSQDQGRTWKGPLNCSPAFAGTAPTLKHDNVTPSRAKFKAAVGAAPSGAVRAHVVFEALQTTSGAPNNEEIYYSAVEFDSSGNLVLAQADVRITAYGQPNEYDVDQPKIEADGPLVAIVWLDDRNGGGNSANKTMVRVSRTGGNAFDSEYDASNVSAASGVDEPHVAVGGANVYVFYEDSRDGSGDDVYVTYSKDTGLNWINTDSSGNPIRINPIATSDVDDFAVTAERNTVAIAYRDERAATNNSTNQVYVKVDTMAGDGFRANTVAEVNTSLASGTTDEAIIEVIDMKGQYIVTAGEADTPGGEGATVTWSGDGGKTFRATEHTPGPDVDEPYASVSLNGDLTTVWVQDFGGGNTGNKTLVSGVKTPQLLDQTAMNNGILLTGAQQSAGKLAFLLMSITGTSTPFILDNMGFDVNLTQDAVTAFGLGVPAVFARTIDANGEARFELVPNFAQQTGVDVYYAAVTIDVAQSTPWLQFSDPLLQKK